MLNYLSKSVTHFHVFFGEMSIEVIYLSFHWIIYFLALQLWSLHILDINFLTDISFENIFSHPIGFYSTMLIVSLAVQRFAV